MKLNTRSSWISLVVNLLCFFIIFLRLSEAKSRELGELKRVKYSRDSETIPEKQYHNSRISDYRPLQPDHSPNSLQKKLKIGFYFSLWYILNIWYNISNKKALNALPLPWSIGTAQLGIGSLWVSLLWLFRLRRAPHIYSNSISRAFPVALFHGGGQLATVLSLGAGAVSFTHIVKAAEPLFSALVAAIFFNQIFKLQVYLTLFPVIFGVSLACAKELNFSWKSFFAAMASNNFFALRANFSKMLMHRPLGDNMHPANLYGFLTILSFFICLPLALLLEMSKYSSTWKSSVSSIESSSISGHLVLLQLIVISGLTHYLNNEVMYLALGAVHPITLAVGNTLKRVFIIVASLVVFRNPITPAGAVGSIIAIIGVQLYSWARQLQA